MVVNYTGTIENEGFVFLGRSVLRTGNEKGTMDYITPIIVKSKVFTIAVRFFKRSELRAQIFNRVIHSLRFDEDFPSLSNFQVVHVHIIKLD